MCSDCLSLQSKLSLTFFDVHSTYKQSSHVGGLIIVPVRNEFRSGCTKRTEYKLVREHPFSGGY